MKLSIVVPAFNEEALLPGTLAALRAALPAFEARGWATELVVCDNNSTDRTGEIARAAGAQVIFEAVNQIARARNAGARAATGDWLVFVDADSRPPAALFEDTARAIASGRTLAGGATVAFEQAVGLPARIALSAWNALSRATRWAAGAYIFCEAAAFREAGGFDETLYASEEIDLFRRLKRLARRRRRRIVILARHPLRTSGRKLRLYGPGELSGFLLRTLVTGGRTLRSRKDCFAWYDGRR